VTPSALSKIWSNESYRPHRQVAFRVAQLRSSGRAGSAFLLGECRRGTPLNLLVRPREETSAMSNQPSMPVLLELATLALVFTSLIACSPTTRKLDEATIHEGPHFRLKLVRYYENLPFHYTGEVFRVQCSSARTTNSPGHKTQDPGWVELGGGGAIGSKSAAELAERERRNYIVVDEQTLVWLGNGVSVSFDACGQFRGWYPTSLPEELIDPAEKPEYCAPRGTADCRHYDFLGDREPRFEEIRVSPQGNISFVVRSKAFRHHKAVRVQSMDFGRTWKAAPL
jgi:hypothetical protein